MSSAGTTTGTEGGAPVLLSADPSFAKLDPVIQGHFKNKGWDGKTAFEAAVEAAKSHAEAERALGIPKDQIVRKPKDAADKDGWANFNKSMGVPEKPDAYDFSKVKFGDGSDLDDSFVGTMRNVAHAAGLRPEQANAVVAEVVKFMDGSLADESAQATAALAASRDALAKSWGTNAEANRFIAGQAAIKLGLGEDVIDQIEKAAGYEKTMQALLKIGQAMGEDKFIADPNRRDGDKTIMTREQAAARLEQLKADDEWVKKVNSGDYKANEEFNNLTRIMSLGT